MKTKFPIPFNRRKFLIPSQIALVVLTLGAIPFIAPLPARAQEDIVAGAQPGSGGESYRLFYDKLGDQGDWIATQQYGYVFQPHVAGSNHGWRPYTDGYWAQTDAGWTWVSNENFGWATYHYGHWANIVDAGWVWVPGNDWSPGNVSWRVSRDHRHVGWAPLPPEARVEHGEQLEGWVDTAYDIGPESYTFIETTHFGEPTYVSHIVPVEQNVTIILETENVTRVNYRTVDTREVCYNGGPEITIFTERGGPPVRHLDLELRPQNAGYFEAGDSHGYNAVNGNRFVVNTADREVITSNTIRTVEPARVTRRLNTVTVDRGYRGLGDPQTIERVRTQLRTQSPPPPPLVEQRATAALKKNGTNVPPNTAKAGVPEALAPATNPRLGSVPPTSSPVVDSGASKPLVSDAKAHPLSPKAAGSTPAQPGSGNIASPKQNNSAPKPSVAATVGEGRATPAVAEHAEPTPVRAIGNPKGIKPREVPPVTTEDKAKPNDIGTSKTHEVTSPVAPEPKVKPVTPPLDTKEPPKPEPKAKPEAAEKATPAEESEHKQAPASKEPVEKKAPAEKPDLAGKKTAEPKAEATPHHSSNETVTEKKAAKPEHEKEKPGTDDKKPNQNS